MYTCDYICKCIDRDESVLIDLDLIHNYRPLLFIDMLYMGVTEIRHAPKSVL